MMRYWFAVIPALLLVYGCNRNNAMPPLPTTFPVDVIKIAPQDTPIVFNYDGQTQSSRRVEIYARVEGFLEKRLYTEGSMVQAGQVLFQQDRKPFEAELAAQEGALAAHKARLEVAEKSLARVKPLVAQNALSQKDLDDAIGDQLTALAAVKTASANVVQAKLNLGYTTITSPLDGLSSFANVNEGAFVSSQNNFLTYIDQVDPIYVNFSLSENTILAFEKDRKNGTLIPPKNDDYEVEITLVNGQVYPQKGRITFTNADFDQETGTYLLRSTLPNPKGMLRAGQGVRVAIKGAIRPKAILVPQVAVLQGAKGHFVIVVDSDNKAQIRPVQVGIWHGDQWFIEQGLNAGDLVVVNGMVRLTPGVSVTPTVVTLPTSSVTH